MSKNIGKTQRDAVKCNGDTPPLLVARFRFHNYITTAKTSSKLENVKKSK